MLCVRAEIEVQYQKNMQRLSEAEEKKRRTEQNEIEDRMKSRIVTLVQDHDRALRGAEEYYSAIQKKLLVDQKMLKVLGFGKIHLLPPPPPKVKQMKKMKRLMLTWCRLISCRRSCGT